MSTGRAAADMSPAERRTIVNQVFVDRKIDVDIMGRIDRMRRDRMEGAEPACMTLVGETGVGKSTLLERYCAGNPPFEEHDEDGGTVTIRPVVYVQLRSDMTVGGAAEGILKALIGDAAPKGRAVRDGMLELHLKRQKVEVILLDEYQHVAEKGADKTRSATADWIKFLVKQTKIPVVMAGMPAIDEVVDGNPQLRSLARFRKRLDVLRYATTAEKNGFRDFLANLDELLPFRELSMLGRPAMANRLYLASGGYLRLLLALVREAARNAIDADAACIRMRDLAEAFEEVRGVESCAENPFDPDELEEAA